MNINIMSKPFLVAATASVVASGLGAYVWHEQYRPPLLEVYIFALKSGHSMFIRTPDDQRILVDGGGNSQVIEQLTDIIPFYSRRIDTVIITNTDSKNASGLIDVVDRYHIDKVYIPKYTLENLDISSSTDKTYQTFLETIKKKNIQTKQVESGDKLFFDKEIVLNIIFPVPKQYFIYSKSSSPEIFFNILYGENSILSIGDASKKVQKFIASTSPSNVIDVDVLIVSHSAIAGNMSLEFMDLVQPNILIYEKSITSIVPKTKLASVSKISNKISKKSPKKISIDPLSAILESNRFNLKETGTLKIVSDGNTIQIKNPN